MKRFFILLTLILFTATILAEPGSRPPRDPKPNRGDDFGKRITLGIAFGLGGDWMFTKIDSLQRAGSIMSVKYGVPLDINFTKKNNYYFSTGIFFNHAGGKISFPNLRDSLTVDNIKRTYNAIYLTIPTGIKLKTPDMSGFVIGAQFGLYHSFRLTSKYRDEYIIDGEKKRENKKVCTDEMALFREAAYIGLGVEYIIHDDFRIYLYGTYTHAFTNFFNPKNSVNSTHITDNKASLGNFDFTIGICF